METGGSGGWGVLEGSVEGGSHVQRMRTMCITGSS